MSVMKKSQSGAIGTYISDVVKIMSNFDAEVVEFTKSNPQL
jgi:hypothetical protein